MSGIMLRACCRSLRPLVLQDSLMPLSSQVNTLFTSGYLGLDQFLDTRHRVAGQFGPLKDKFFQRMKENVDPVTPETTAQDRMIFTEDLKNTTFLIENKPEDLELVSSMIKKFNLQNKDMRFGSFVFGPVVMRLLHSFRQPDLALSLVRDPGCEGFFNQLTSYVILLDLLYEAEKFGEVITVFEDLLSRGVFANSYPRDMVCLVFAAAYRIGTPEAYNKAKKIATDARKAESFLSARAICLMAAMAIRHGDPETGFELLAILRTQNYIARNIKLVTLCHLKRPDDALMLARSYLARDRGEGKFSGEFTVEALDILAQAAAESGQQDLVTEAEQVIRSLKEGQHISSRTLEQMLLEPIEHTRSFNQSVAGTTGSPDNRRLMPPARSDDRFERYNNRMSDGNNQFGYNNRQRRSSDDRSQRSFEPRRGLREME